MIGHKSVQLYTVHCTLYTSNIQFIFDKSHTNPSILVGWNSRGIAVTHCTSRKQ